MVVLLPKNSKNTQVSSVASSSYTYKDNESKQSEKKCYCLIEYLCGFTLTVLYKSSSLRDWER